MSNDVVKSLEYDQNTILKDILRLNNLELFEGDLTYGNGVFYKEIPEPWVKLDIDPQADDVIRASSTETGFPDGSFNSLVFDPPFVTYVRSGREGNGKMVMANRFSGYWRYDELETHYKDTLIEAARILNKKGILVFKCQDIIHNHKMHCTHANVLKWSEGLFRLKDLHVLGAKHRLPAPNRRGTQKHARIFHCYFLVLERV